MNYNECVDCVLAIPRYKKKTDQRAIAQLLKVLGNPQESFRIVHVAGTNGKGSICACLNQIGMDFGERMGLFTSPHLIDIRERFRVNNIMIEQTMFVSIYEQVEQAKRILVDQEGLPPFTFFETIFAMGMLYFKEMKVHVAIVEAGMGGRSDTTNVLHPDVCIVASVGLDHMAILGNTMEKIAYEKAGIMKSNVPAVISPQIDSVREIFCKVGAEVGAKCYFIQDYGIQILKNTAQGIDFSINSEYDKKGFHVGLLGDYQAENALCAMQAAKLLWNRSFDDMADSLARVSWAGRLEQVEPDLYVDGAHNPQAIQRFVENCKIIFLDRPIIFVFAVASDKEDKPMIEMLLSLMPEWFVITQIQGMRKTDGGEIEKISKEILKKHNNTKTQIQNCSNDFKEALSFAKQKKGDARIICVGSLYLVSEIKEWLLESEDKL